MVHSNPLLRGQEGWRFITFAEVMRCSIHSNNNITDDCYCVDLTLIIDE